MSFQERRDCIRRWKTYIDSFETYETMKYSPLWLWKFRIHNCDRLFPRGLVEKHEFLWKRYLYEAELFDNPHGIPDSEKRMADLQTGNVSDFYTNELGVRVAVHMKEKVLDEPPPSLMAFKAWLKEEH